MKLNITTFNIRCDHNQDAENSFCYREPLIKKAIAERNSDIIGFQEVLPHVFRWLQKNLSDYNVVGCGRAINLKDEHMVIAYKKDKFELLDLHTFWLSETPDVFGSRFLEQSLCPRICTIALLREYETDKLIKVYVTHLDHETEYARKHGLKLIFQKIIQDQKDFYVPSILMGDFNTTPTTINLNSLNENLEIPFKDFSENSGITYHEYNKLDEKIKIDYILGTSDFLFHNVTRWEDCQNGVFLSDHYPVQVFLELL